jgi:hypothetical protein
MALVTLGGFDVIEADLQIPRYGVWTVDAVVDSKDATQLQPGAQVALQVNGPNGSLTMKCTPLPSRSAVFLDTIRLRLAAGAAGMSTIAKPAYYSSGKVTDVVAGLLKTAGETISGTADPTVLAALIQRYTVFGHPVGIAIAALVRAVTPAGTAWRMLADGTFWMGPESWPDSGISASAYVVMDQLPQENRQLLGIDSPIALPGTTIAGAKVSAVHTKIRDDKIRSLLWLED